MPARADISQLSPEDQARIIARRGWSQKHMAKKRTQEPEAIKAARERRYAKLRKMASDDPQWQKLLASNRKWKRENKTKRAAADRHKWSENLSFRLKKNLRLRLYLALNGRAKPGSAVRDLGCSIDELRNHLEDRFLPGMTWENYGVHGWHVDHKIPLALFDLTDAEQFERAVHYTNLQPKWALDNLSKGASLEPPSLF